MKNMLTIGFISIILALSCQKQEKSIPVISRVQWITVHVRTQEAFQSLYQFFNDDLQFPVFFHPEKWGNASYTAIWAQDVVFEICGPFPDSPYSDEDVMARCNTLIFRPWESGQSSALELKRRLIDHEGPTESSLINLEVIALNTESMPVNISDSSHVSKKDRSRVDSLNTVLRERDGGPIGFKNIKEVYIGYTNDAYLKKWARFLKPFKSKENLWSLPEKPDLRFIESNSEDIRAFVFQVASLEKAKKYLRDHDMLGDVGKNWAEINKDRTNGLKIILQE